METVTDNVVCTRSVEFSLVSLVSIGAVISVFLAGTATGHVAAVLKPLRPFGY